MQAGNLRRDTLVQDLTLTERNVLDRLYDALERGDPAAALACFAPGGGIWHNFDGVVQDMAAVERGWRDLVAATTERRALDIRRQATATGFVQQHVFAMRLADGGRRTWHVCLVARVADGLIERLDEYIDRAADGAVVTA